jgi:hypothetical protein
MSIQPIQLFCRKFEKVADFVSCKSPFLTKTQDSCLIKERLHKTCNASSHQSKFDQFSSFVENSKKLPFFFRGNLRFWLKRETDASLRKSLHEYFDININKNLRKFGVLVQNSKNWPIVVRANRRFWAKNARMTKLTLSTPTNGSFGPNIPLLGLKIPLPRHKTAFLGPQTPLFQPENVTFGFPKSHFLRF